MQDESAPGQPIDAVDFELEIGHGSGGEYPIAVVQSPAGRALATLVLPFDAHAPGDSLPDLQNALGSGGRGRKGPVGTTPAVQAFGRRLFDAVFDGEVRALYDLCRQQAADADAPFRLKLHLHPAELAALPWEFLYDAGRDEFVCLSGAASVVRDEDQPQAGPPADGTLPLRILGIIAHPPGDVPPAAQRAREAVEKATQQLRARGLVELEWVEGLAWRDVQRALWRGQWHVLHFVGDGGFDAEAQESYVLLADEEGRSHRLDAGRLSRVLASRVPAPLVWLSLGDGAPQGIGDRFAGTAAALVQRGIAAVLSVPYPLTASAATAFARAFYETLCQAMPVERAVAQGRRAIREEQPDSIEWGIPVLYSHTPDVRLYEREALAETACRQGDEALAHDEFERAIDRYALAAEMGAGPAALEGQAFAEQARRTLQEAQDTLSKLSGSAEAQADVLIAVIGNLERLQQRLSTSRAVQVVLRRAREAGVILRDRLWQDARRMMRGRAIGRTLGQRTRRMHRCVHWLELARQLDPEELPALRDELSKAANRLSYLESAQARVQTTRGGRLRVYGIFAAVAVAVLALLLFVFWPRFTATPPAAASPVALTSSTPSTATESVAEIAAPASSPLASPAVTQPLPVATNLTATPTLQPSAAPATGAAASQTATPAPLPTGAPTVEATATPSVSRTPTGQPTPSVSAPGTRTAEATPSSPPTWTPTLGPVPPTLTPSAGSVPASPTTIPTPFSTATATAGFAYAAPTLVQPEDIVYLSQYLDTRYLMEWQWDGTLGKDEYFDVRVWREGMPHHGVAWTKNQEYMYDICLKGNGEWYWSIAVIRGVGGLWLADLSPEASPRRFSSSRSDEWCVSHGRLFLGETR